MLSSAIGLTVDCGAKCSMTSVAFRAFSARTSVSSDDPFPFSKFVRARFEIPPLLDNSFWLRFFPRRMARTPNPKCFWSSSGVFNERSITRRITLVKNELRVSRYNGASCKK